MSVRPAIEVAFAGDLGKFRLDARFDAPGKGITALFGPSGCGKTSVLRCIAGLQRLGGACRVAGEVWQDGDVFLPPHRRAVGYVFQEASLFPHMSVRANLLYSSHGKVLPSASGRIGFDEVVDLLGLDALMGRATQHLSGGERQRVAVGRALLSQPRLLLMDEPLSALDRQSRDEILPFLERLHDTLEIPAFYVTHDMAEVERLADHLVLMRAGKVEAAGPLGGIQADVDLSLARQREAAVSLDAVVAGYDRRYGLARLDVAGGSFLVPSAAEHPVGTGARLRIGAGEVSLAREAPHATSILNLLPARILQARPIDEREMILVLGLGAEGDGATLLARLTRMSWDHLGLAPGMAVVAQVKSAALSLR